MSYQKQNFENGDVLNASNLIKLEDGIIALEPRNAEIWDKCASYKIVQKFEDYAADTAIDISTGETYTKSKYVTQNGYFDCDGGKTLFITYTAGVDTDWATYNVPWVAFFDHSKKFISGAQFSYNTPVIYRGLSGMMMPIPDGAAYFRATSTIYTYQTVRFDVLVEAAPVMGKEMKYLGANPSSHPLYGRRVLCFGDSITGSFVERQGGRKSWVQMFMESTGADAKNVGFGGCEMSERATVADTYNNFSMVKLAESILSGDWTAQEKALAALKTAGMSTSDLTIYTDHVETLKATDFKALDYITIAYGTNDWGSNKVIADSGENTDTVQGALRYALRILSTVAPQAQIAVMSVIPRFGTPTKGGDGVYVYTPTGKNTQGDTLEAYRDALKTVAEEFHVGFIDLWTCGFNQYNAPYYFPPSDGVHPASFGRKVIADKVAGYFASKN